MSESSDCVNDLDAYALVAGALAPDRITAVVAHADSCQLCRELIEGLCAVEAGNGDTLPAADAPMVDPMIGGELAGGYRITELIAIGGMGRIYRAQDGLLGRDVAIKLPRSRSPWLVRRFEREVAITARLQHPGIVPVHSTGELDDGTRFYVMPVIDGIPLDVALSRAVNREQRLGLLDHLIAVANTMAFVHEQRIAHRDLKPQNVLIGRFGETLIIDWGLAKQLDASDGAPAALPLPRKCAVAPAAKPATASVAQVLAGRTTRPGDVLGTPAFMSPEQARGEAVDQRSDVYALGAMLEQLLTGRLPRKVADAALTQAPPELAAICRRAMQPDREARYRDCGELAAELRAAPRHRAAVQSTPARAGSPRRWPLVVVATACVAFGVAIAQLGWS
ncbi:MAG: serine/threonine-protein kinase [Kofleriaceae bacterium]